MPPLTDKNQIRALLQSDPRWCVYALGDLTPRMFEKCLWFTPDLTMVLHDYGTCILFAHGAGGIREALDHVSYPVHLQVRQDALDDIATHASVSNITHMQRMALNRRASIDVDSRVKRLTMNDVESLKTLYRDGASSGEAPDFFYDSMVADGVFFGVYEGAEMIAAAGTHLVARDEGAAAIGNVYVRRDRRGAGLGRIVTATVMSELEDVATVGLNVRADNAAAIRVYESLGFVKHCDFFEAIATRR
jgi:ribosomal protein S18 acetylase RimI-like enzyme